MGKANVVNIMDKRVQKKVESISPEQQLKLYTISQVFTPDKLTEMLTMAPDDMPMGEAIDTAFMLIAEIIYGEGKGK